MELRVTDQVSNLLGELIPFRAKDFTVSLDSCYIKGRRSHSPRWCGRERTRSMCKANLGMLDLSYRVPFSSMHRFEVDVEMHC